MDVAQSYASSLRKSWVREHLPAQETQNLGVRAFDAVKQWHLGRKGKPRLKPVSRGLHSLAAKDGNGSLRPKIDEAGRLVGLQWGAGFMIPIAPPAQSGRRGKEQQTELAEIETLIAAGKLLSTRIVRSVINGRDTYRMQMVVDGHPTRRHPIGAGRVSFDLGPSAIAVAIERADGETLWREDRIDALLASAEDNATPLFVQGTTRNQVQFNPCFNHIVLLSAPAEVLIERLKTRTSNPYGKDPADIAETPDYLDTVEPLLRVAATLEVVTTVPVAQVADIVLERVL